MQLRDYRENIIRNYVTGETSPTGLPQSNVLYFDLEDDAWCCVRPSGTEPKIKLYAGVRCRSEKEAELKLDFLMKGVSGIFLM